MSSFIDETIDLLHRTPQLLRALLTGLPDAWTNTPDTDGGWRPHDVVGHLITGEMTWAVHDLDHVAQIFAGLAGSHDADVGPWKAYTGILLRREDPSAVAG